MEKKIHYYQFGAEYPKCKVDPRVRDKNGNTDIDKVTCKSCIRRVAWERRDRKLLEKLLSL